MIQETDIDWMKALAMRRYSNRLDFDAAEMWIRNVVLKQAIGFFPIRSDHAYLIAILSLRPWLPQDSECNIAILCAENGYLWEAMALLRRTVEWAKKRRCTALYISSETTYDLGPMAKRLGATFKPRYEVTLG